MMSNSNQSQIEEKIIQAQAILKSLNFDAER